MNIRAVSCHGRQVCGDTFRSRKGAYRSAVKGVRLIDVELLHEFGFSAKSIS